MAVLTVSMGTPGLRPPHFADPTGDGRDPGCLPPSGTQLDMLYLGLYLTVLGTGGLKSSVSAFGSDQFDESQAGERLRMPRFFGCFFFFNSLGPSVLLYVQDNVLLRLLQHLHRACVRAGQRWAEQ